MFCYTPVHLLPPHEEQLAHSSRLSISFAASEAYPNVGHGCSQLMFKGAKRTGRYGMSSCASDVSSATKSRVITFAPCRSATFGRGPAHAIPWLVLGQLIVTPTAHEALRKRSVPGPLGVWSHSFSCLSASGAGYKLAKGTNLVSASIACWQLTAPDPESTENWSLSSSHLPCCTSARTRLN